MSVVIEIKNIANLDKARAILGADSNSETLELALERVVADDESVEKKVKAIGLTDEYWDDLFSDPPLQDNAATKALLDDRNEARY